MGSSRRILIALCLAGCGSFGSAGDGTGGGDAGGLTNNDGGAGDGSSEAGGGTCQGGTCVEVPPGWTLLAFASRLATCPAGYGQQTDATAFDPNSPCTCDCTTPTQANCSNPVTFHEGSLCPQPTSTSVALAGAPVTGSSSCKAQNITTTATSLADVGVTGATCGGTGGGKSATVSARRCAAPPGTCTAPSGASGTCAPTLPAIGSFDACLSQGGDVACPLAYPRKLLLGDSVASDTRACGTCTCTPPPQACVLELFTDAQCASAGKLSISPNACTPTTAVSYQSYRFRSNGPCAGTTPALTGGSLTMTNPVTVCCPSNGGA